MAFNHDEQQEASAYTLLISVSFVYILACAVLDDELGSISATRFLPRSNIVRYMCSSTAGSTRQRQ